jgi:hypothetical protein
MIFLLELKENIKRFFNKYDVYIIPSAKLILAFISFMVLNASIGYMSKLSNPVIAILLSVACAFVPSGFTIFILSVFMLLYLYAISAEFSLIVLAVVLIMYLLYFRFTPKQGSLLLITAIFCWIKMPYMIPVAVGLCSGISSVIPVSFGVIIYYIVQTASAYEAAITKQSVTDSVQKISYIVESLINNKAMILLIVAFVVTIAVVYFVRRMKIDNAWTYAIVAGTAVQLLVLIGGQIAFSTKLNMVLMIIGIILGAGVGYLCQIMFFSVDYKRTEFVQYEDDEYYYYVKAVPKINIVNEDVKVKQINARKTKKTMDINDVAKLSNDKNININTFDDED